MELGKVNRRQRIEHPGVELPVQPDGHESAARLRSGPLVDLPAPANHLQLERGATIALEQTLRAQHVGIGATLVSTLIFLPAVIQEMDDRGFVPDLEIWATNPR